MIPANIPGRVAILERQMHAIAARFDALSGQISQFREEVHVALSATKDDLQQADEAIRREVRAVHEEALAALAATKAELKRDNEETRHQMLVLHEAVMGTLKTISQG